MPGLRPADSAASDDPLFQAEVAAYLAFIARVSTLPGFLATGERFVFHSIGLTVSKVEELVVNTGNLTDPAGDSTYGFVCHGANEGDLFGASVAGIGDMNGDGIDDLLIRGGQACDRSDEVYLVYGGLESLAALDASDGLADGVIDMGLL